MCRLRSSQLAVGMWMLLATYAFYRLYHVRNPDIPQMDFHTLLIVLKTVPDQPYPKKKGLSLVFRAKFVYEGKDELFL